MKIVEYIAKCGGESVKRAEEWGRFNSEREAHKSGREGCENGLGRTYRIVQVVTTYRVSETVFKYKKSKKGYPPAEKK